MLTRDQRDQWAEELESGRWKQAHHVFFRENRMCCLGVLVTILRRDDPAAYLLGCTTERERRQFIKLNDRDRLTFPEIAEHVRALPVSDGEP